MVWLDKISWHKHFAKESQESGSRRNHLVVNVHSSVHLRLWNSQNLIIIPKHSGTELCWAPGGQAGEMKGTATVPEPSTSSRFHSWEHLGGQTMQRCLYSLTHLCSTEEPSVSTRIKRYFVNKKDFIETFLHMSSLVWALGRGVGWDEL